jgi:hypothetical protein
MNETVTIRRFNDFDRIRVTLVIEGRFMTVTLNLPPQVEQAYLAEAQAKGLTLDELVRDVVFTG